MVSVVIDVLTCFVSERVAPRFLRSDKGSKFVSHVILGWFANSGIETANIDPGKPRQNADSYDSVD